MLLFLLAAGLSLIYGLMKILNLTHGSFYLVGGYIGLTVMQLTGSFVLALIVAAARRRAHRRGDRAVLPPALPSRRTAADAC